MNLECFNHFFRIVILCHLKLFCRNDKDQSYPVIILFHRIILSHFNFLINYIVSLVNTTRKINYLKLYRIDLYLFNSKFQKIFVRIFHAHLDEN